MLIFFYVFHKVYSKSTHYLKEDSSFLFYLKESIFFIKFNYLYLLIFPFTINYSSQHFEGDNKSIQ